MKKAWHITFIALMYLLGLISFVIALPGIFAFDFAHHLMKAKIKNYIP